MATVSCPERSRQLLVLSCPGLWPVWPFLPVARRTGGGLECGLLCDLLGMADKPGLRATVFFCNLFQLPGRLEDFLELPREVFDTPEELFDAGWRID